MSKPIRVLLVEDNAGDAELTCEMLEDGAHRLDGTHRLEISVVVNGAEAADYLLHRGVHAAVRSPDLVLLDINMPKMDGLQLLAEIQRHDELRSIPVVMWTTSNAERDIVQSYALGARCYVTKPVDLGAFQAVLRSIERFWFSVAKLP